MPKARDGLALCTRAEARLASRRARACNCSSRAQGVPRSRPPTPPALVQSLPASLPSPCSSCYGGGGGGGRRGGSSGASCSPLPTGKASPPPLIGPLRGRGEWFCEGKRASSSSSPPPPPRRSRPPGSGQSRRRFAQKCVRLWARGGALGFCNLKVKLKAGEEKRALKKLKSCSWRKVERFVRVCL